MDAETYMQDWIAKGKPANLAREKHRTRFAEIARRLPVDTEDDWRRYADIGCACGHSTMALRELVPGDWSGVDFSLSAIREAERLFPVHSWFHVPNPECLKALCEVDPWECVVCSEVLEHVEDDIGFVDTLTAVTSEVLVLTTPSRPVDDPGHLRVYTREALEALFAPYGGALIEGDFNFWYVTWRS